MGVFHFFPFYTRFYRRFYNFHIALSQGGSSELFIGWTRVVFGCRNCTTHLLLD
jgi:hypothetical protein